MTNPRKPGHETPDTLNSMTASPDERTAEPQRLPTGSDAPRLVRKPTLAQLPAGALVKADAIADDPDEALRLQRAQLLAELLVETLGQDETRQILSEALAPHGGARVTTSVSGAVDRVLERLLTLTQPILA